MITLEEAIHKGYRSAAIGNATALTKLKIIQEERAKIKASLKSVKLGTKYRAYFEKILTLWNNLYISTLWAHKFFEGGISGGATSVKWNLEDCWTDLGNDIADLPNWEFYKTLSIIEPVSFTEDPPWSVSVLETDFDNQSIEFTEADDWKARYFKLFDLLTHDIWKEEAMRQWLRDNLDRESADPSVLWHWDTIIAESEVFFGEGAGCLSGLNLAATIYQNPELEDFHNTKQQIEDKYKYLETNKVTGAGGLYTINYEKLPAEWQAKVEVVNINYE